MKIRSVFVLMSLAASIAAVACSGSHSDSSALTSPALDAGSTANAVTGGISGLSGSCPVVTFKLEQRTIKTDANTSYADGSCVALKNLLRVEVSGTVQADGAVLATRVHVLPPVTTPPPTPTAPTTVSIAGTVSALTGACPSVSFKLEQRLIKTDATTVFADTKCADLTNDVRVEITGVVQGDGSVLALKVHIVVTPPPPPPPPPTPTNPTTVAIAGTASALGGACPSVTFKLEQRIIRTDATTTFGDNKCTDLKNDQRVEISGTVQADGGILALKVRIVPAVTPPPPPPPPPTPVPPPSIVGVIGSISGSCPTIVITVGDRKAITTSNTVFDGRACAELQVGMGVEIVGEVATATNAFVAQKVTYRK